MILQSKMHKKANKRQATPRIKSYTMHHYKLEILNPFPNKPWFLRVCRKAF